MYSFDINKLNTITLAGDTVADKLRFAADIVEACATPNLPNPGGTSRSAHMLRYYAELALANADREKAVASLTEALDLAGESISTRAMNAAVGVIVGAMRGGEVAA